MERIHQIVCGGFPSVIASISKFFSGNLGTGIGILGTGRGIRNREPGDWYRYRE